MWQPEIIAIVLVTFLLAGLMKGVVGLGLPTVALALLSAVLGHKEAIALILVPSMLTNVWQGLAGGALRAILARLWPLLVLALIATIIGTQLLASTDARVAAGIFGVLLSIYAAYSLVTPQIPAPGKWERWLSPVIGAVAGLLTGVTGSFVVPGVLYLQALNMGRDMLVQTLGVTFTVLTIALALGLARAELLTIDLFGLSALAFFPAALGMVLGQRVRRRLPEEIFRKAFFGALLLLGLYAIVRAFQ